MNLDTPVKVRLDQTNHAAAPGLAATVSVIPEPAATKEVPEASTWILLLVAAGLWLLCLRKRQNGRAR